TATCRWCCSCAWTRCPTAARPGWAPAAARAAAARWRSAMRSPACRTASGPAWPCRSSACACTAPTPAGWTCRSSCAARRARRSRWRGRRPAPSTTTWSPARPAEQSPPPGRADYGLAAPVFSRRIARGPGFGPGRVHPGGRRPLPAAVPTLGKVPNGAVPMIDLYYWPTPNGHKITLLLEELAEAGAPLEYRVHGVDIGNGDQFKPEFLAISPNNKMPAIVDHAPADGGAPLSVFESGAILLYLAGKTGRFLPTDLRGRTATLEWLFWQMAGLGPMTG